eukprot:6736406-Pyramimonas_sp.AAC.1
MSLNQMVGCFAAQGVSRFRWKAPAAAAAPAASRSRPESADIRQPSASHCFSGSLFEPKLSLWLQIHHIMEH